MTEQDEENYMAVMADFDEAILAYECRRPVPSCHFKPMMQQCGDSHPASDDHWYECEHCGHTEDRAEAWAKVKAREAATAAPNFKGAQSPCFGKAAKEISMTKTQQCDEKGIWSVVFNPAYVLGVLIGSAAVIATLGHVFGWWTFPI